MPNEQKPGYIKTQPTTKPPQQKTHTQAKVPRKIGENKSVETDAICHSTTNGMQNRNDRKLCL